MIPSCLTIRKKIMDPAAAFSGINDPQIIVVDGSGRIYWPAKNFYSLTLLLPGQGYTVYVSAPAQLIYPANTAPAPSIGASSSVMQPKEQTR